MRLQEIRERQEILGRIQPKLIEFGLEVEDLQEILTRLALTEITVLRQIERDGLTEVLRRVRAAKE